MHLILKAGVLVFTLTVLPISAQAGARENAAIGAQPESVDIDKGAAPAAAKRIDVQSIGDRSFRAKEVIVSLPSNLPPEAINALARHHRLTHLESRSVGPLGRTLHRWRIADGRSVPNVILALQHDGGINAQPNNIYTLQ